MLNARSSIASTAAATTGNARGSQPAITALTASFSSVTCRHRGGITPRLLAPSRPPSIALTRSSVGAMIGRPSAQLRAVNASRMATGSSPTVIGSVVAGSARPAWAAAVAAVARSFVPAPAAPEMSALSCSKACCARRAIASGRSPPSGCSTTSSSSAPRSPTRRSKFDLVLSRKPTVRPFQLWGSDGTATVCAFTTPTGLRTRIWAMTSPLLFLLQPGRAREKASDRLVQLGQHRALDADRDRLDGLRAADLVDDEGACELRRALVDRGEAAHLQ